VLDAEGGPLLGGFGGEDSPPNGSDQDR
jgi:hypothetical protein